MVIHGNQLLNFCSLVSITIPNGRFVDIADSLGLAGNQGVTLSAVWCDLDDDGWWEVVVGDASAGETLVYDQDSDGFTVRDNPFPSEFPSGFVTGLQWVDIDRDDDFDLLASRSRRDSWVLLNDSGEFTASFELTGTSGFSAANGVAVDYDFDGWVDVVQTTKAYEGPGPEVPQARLMRNMGGYPGFSGDELFDQNSAAGLGLINRATTGLLFDDFDQDGGLDALIGAPTSAQRNFVFRARPSDQEAGFATNWIGVDLVSAADNQSSLGAVVTLRTLSGEVIGKQVVDGGSARGGQQPRKLLFGLGSLNEPIEIQAVWPSNPSLMVLELIDPMAEGFNQVVTLDQGTDIEIHQSSISITKEFLPGTGLLNYGITWTSNRLTDRERDTVVITDGPNYENVVAILNFDSSDVEVLDPEYTRDAMGETTFHHRVKWLGQPCVLGYSFKFEVESCIEDNCVSGTAVNPIVRTKVCLTQ